MKGKTIMATLLAVMLVLTILPSALAATNSVVAVWTSPSGSDTVEILQEDSVSGVFYVYGYDDYDIEAGMYNEEGDLELLFVSATNAEIEDVYDPVSGYGATTYTFTLNGAATADLDGDYTLHVWIEDVDGFESTDEIYLTVDADTDGDEVGDDDDNCPDDYNPDQEDSDGDGIGDVCDTPTIQTNIPDQYVSEGELLTFDIDVEDPNGEAISFTTYITAGAGEDLEDINGESVYVEDNGDGTATVSLQPMYTFVTHTDVEGSFDVQITVNDGSESADSNVFTIDVYDENQEPTITSTPDTTAAEAVEYQYQIEATDADAEDEALGFNYAVLSGPAGMLVDSEGLVTYTPSYYEEGNTYTVNLQVQDVMGGVGTQSFTLEITHTNQLPELVLEDVEVTAGDTATAEITATDADGDSLTLSATDMPEDATFTDNGDGTADFEWATEEDDTTQTITVEVTDGEDIVSGTFTVTVIANAAPVIESIEDQYVTEGDVFELTFAVSDAEGDDFEVEFTSDPVESVLTDNGDGTYTITVETVEGDFATMPENDMVITAVDEHGLTSEEDFVLYILEIGANTPPVFEAVEDQTVTAGETLSLIVTATDADEDGLEILPVEVFGAELVDNGDGTANFEWVTTEDDVQEEAYTVIIEATDGEDSGYLMFLVTVVAAENTEPEFEAVEDQTVTAGDTLSVTVTATDADGDSLVISDIALPDDSTLVDNGDGSAVFEWVTDAMDFSATPYEVTIEVTDGQATNSLTFYVTVNNNHLPELFLPAGQTVEAGETVTEQITATDVDGDTLTLEATNLPDGATFVDNGDGTADFEWDTTGAIGADYSITVTANDGTDSVSGEFTITVTVDADNTAPTLAADPESVNATEGDDVKVTFTASDADGDDLTYSYDGVPDDASFGVKNDGVTAILWWETGAGDAGYYILSVTVTDGTESTVFTVPITINEYVEEPEDPITVTSEGLVVSSAHVSSEEVRAGEHVYVSVGLENQAQEDLEDLQVSVIVYEFATKTTSSEFDLDEDDQISKSVSVNVPNNARPGLYYMKITVSNDDTHATAYRTIRVV